MRYEVLGGANFNLSMYKDFNFTEKAHLRFGADFYNAFNHTQFHDVNTSYGQANFGQVTDTYDPRVIELSLKFAF